MALRLNSILFLYLFCFSFHANVEAQEDDQQIGIQYKDYKDKDQFKKFYKRRKIVSAWQINELKTGALIVRLKTNQRSIDVLNANGKKIEAEEKLIETYIMNMNTMKAYLKNYNFSKVYFIYSNVSDSLLKGVRNGIFLDTNLQVNPSIKMEESFYLLAERDYVYNSTIGYVKEDTAKFIRESGNPVREMGVVVKNKYGHQLKAPFPYYIKSKVFNTDPSVFLASPNQDSPNSFLYSLLIDNNDEKKLMALYPNLKNWHKIKLQQEFTYPKLSLVVSQLNIELKSFFQNTPKPELNKVDEETRKFFY